MKIKSKKIIKLDKSIPVYDITVPLTENFVLESGVVAHNSKDIIDAVCASHWTCNRDLKTSESTRQAEALLDRFTEGFSVKMNEAGFEDKLHRLLK